MHFKGYTSEGVVLARRNYSEADRILVVLSRNFGKINLLAKGVRKPKSKKRGSLEIFSRMKFSASKGHGLDIITETDVIDSFKLIRKNIKKVTVAYYFVEVIGRVSHEGEKNIYLYDLLINYFEELIISNNLKKLRNRFIYDVLVLLGFWPKGRLMNNPDKILEDIIEREPNSKRVGKKILN